MTCNCFKGSHRYGDQDEQIFARWGIDLLKYGWCSGDLVCRPGERAPDGLETELRPQDVIFPECLKAAGYVTKQCGKCHLGTKSSWMHSARMLGALSVHRANEDRAATVKERAAIHELDTTHPLTIALMMARAGRVVTVQCAP